MTVTYGMARRSPTRRARLEPAARFGLSARALIYLVIGILAFAVAAGHSNAETDQWGALEQLNRGVGGHILLWAVSLGLAGYASWRLSEAVFGAAGEGKKAGPRLISLGRACIYTVIAVNAFQIALGRPNRSQAGRQEGLSAKVMQHSGGRVAVGVVGAVVLVIGLALAYEGVTRRFKRYLDMGGASAFTRRAVTALGVVGTTARGVVFSVAGVFVIQAAWQYRPQKAAGLDGALRSLRDTSLGPSLLALASVGLILFGLYGFCEARWRRT